MKKRLSLCLFIFLFGCINQPKSKNIIVTLTSSSTINNSTESRSINPIPTVIPTQTAHTMLEDEDILYKIEYATNISIEYAEISLKENNIISRILLTLENGKSYIEISNDGRWITYLDQFMEYAPINIYYYDINKKVETTADSNLSAISFPHWSPNNKYLTYNIYRNNAGPIIFVPTLECNNSDICTRKILYSPKLDFNNLVWSHNGNEFVFTKENDINENNNAEICITTLAKMQISDCPIQVTGEFNYLWSIDDKYLFVTETKGIKNIIFRFNFQEYEQTGSTNMEEILVLNNNIFLEEISPIGNYSIFEESSGDGNNKTWKVFIAKIDWNSIPIIIGNKYYLYDNMDVIYEDHMIFSKDDKLFAYSSMIEGDTTLFNYRTCIIKLSDVFGSDNFEINTCQIQYDGGVPIWLG